MALDLSIDRPDLFWAWAFASRHTFPAVFVLVRTGFLQKMFKEVHLFDLREINADYLFMSVKGIVRWNKCPLHVVPLQLLQK